MSPAYRVGSDIGGTFTDLVMTGPRGRLWTRKVLSTPDDYSRAVVDGVADMLREAGVSGSDVSEVVHGTTVATNAIMENRGAKTALITTKGFRDVLELRRLRVPELFSRFYVPPRPLVERRLRMEVTERLAADGQVLTALDEATVDEALDRIELDGAEAVAVCLIHSYLDPRHERRVGELVRRRLPKVFLSLSADVLPEIREYERTSTTVVNAYVGPIVKKYIESLGTGLSDKGIRGRLRIMQSNGGVMSARAAAERPAYIVESGPAAGVVGAHRAALAAGLANVITFDMGGTTAKASLIERGERSWTNEYEVGAGIQLSSKLVKGRGHAVRLPVLDIAEVGAGGGSIVWVDKGGALKVGPQSAGAMPGPACYGLGGRSATVTDANVVLGYVSGEGLAGGAVRISASLAKEAVRRNAAKPLNLDLMEAAYGIHAVANTNMIRALKAVSTYRGRDPREFALFAFGGNGPVHAGGLAMAMGITQVIVPPHPGLFSAVGMLYADPERHFVQTLIGRTSEVRVEVLEKAFGDVEGRAAKEMESEGYARKSVVWKRLADLRYVGQAFELTVGIPKSDRRSAPDALAARFHDEHKRTYGHNAPDEPVELVNLRVVARVVRRAEANRIGAGEAVPDMKDASRAPKGRRAYFGKKYGTVVVDVIARSELRNKMRKGPLIIEEYDATTVVPPGCTARVDSQGNIVIAVTPDSVRTTDV